MRGRGLTQQYSPRTRISADSSLPEDFPRAVPTFLRLTCSLGAESRALYPQHRSSRCSFPNEFMAKGRFSPVPPEASNVVKVPFAWRTKALKRGPSAYGIHKAPCRTPFASMYDPVIHPKMLIALATVPWLFPVLASGASNNVTVPLLVRRNP